MMSLDSEIAELKAKLSAARAEKRKEKKRAYRERPEVKEKKCLRAFARAEAKETGQPIEIILARMTSKILAA